MNWNNLQSKEQIEQIKIESTVQPVLIFKHSTKCSISRTTLDRLERNWNENEMQGLKAYYLDLLSYRDISNALADDFEIQHESPQVLIIKNGKAIYHNSHFDINYKDLTSFSKN